MKITLDESYRASADVTTLGYVGETNSRAITIEGYQCEGADSYKMRLKYPDGVVYDVDISDDGTYTIKGSILRRVGDVYLQILACKQNGDQYEYVKKSNILTLHICRSLNGDVAPVPTYEKSVEALEKVIAISAKVDGMSDEINDAITAANTAKTDLQTAVDNANAVRAEVEKSTANATTAKSEIESATTAANTAKSNLTAAQTAAETALTNLNAAIAHADTSDSDLKSMISDAETVRDQLSDVITAANNANTTLSDTVSTAANLYTSLLAENETAAENIVKLAEENTKAEGLYFKADGIVCSAEGTAITLNDSSELPFSGMRIFGRSTQKTTTGAQLLNPDLYNSAASSKGITFSVNSDGSITLTGTPTVSEGIVFTYFLGDYADLLEDGKTYVTNAIAALRVTENGEDKYTKKVTVNKSTVTSIMPYVQVTLDNYKDGMTLYPTLSEGDTAIEWEPYTGGQKSPNPEYPQEIVSVGNSGGIDVYANGKNLLPDKSSATRGVAVSVNNGVLKMVGTVDNTLTASRVYWASNTLKNILIPGKTYYLWCDNPDIHFRFFVSNAQQYNVAEYTVTGDETSIAVWLILGDIPQAEGDKIDITARVSLSECEPQTMNISTPNGLPGIPVDSGGNYTDENGQQWLCDEIDLGRRVYVQRTEQTKLMSDDNWKLNNAGNRYYYNNPTAAATLDSGIICTHFSCGAWVKNTINTISCGNGFQGIIGISVLNFDSVDVLKSFLNDNDVYIRYILAEPIETSLTAEQIAAYKSLHTNKPTTVISNSDNAHMAVDYTADTKTYIDNKFNELATAIIATGGDT